MKHMLVTGATGALGRGVMASLLEAMPETRFTVLTRRPGQGMAHPRVREVRCDLKAGEWTRELPPHLGPSLTGVLHMAADVRWNASADDALAMNTRVCAQLADWTLSACGRLERFCYVSTAYVDAPSHLEGVAGCIRRQERLYNNSYEYSKSRGEGEITARPLPSVIVRPSLIVGDSRTGEIGSFNGLYTLLRFASQGLIPIIAGRRESYVDIVSLDTVVEAVLRAFAAPTLPAGQVVLAMSGGGAPTVGELIDSALDVLNAFRGERGAAPIALPPMVPYATYRRLHKPWFEQQASALQKRMMEYIDVFTPYLSITDVFRPGPSDLVVQSPDWRQTLPAAIRYWCEVNEDNALKPPRIWKAAS